MAQLHLEHLLPLKSSLDGGPESMVGSKVGQACDSKGDRSAIQISITEVLTLAGVGIEGSSLIPDQVPDLTSSHLLLR